MGTSTSTTTTAPLTFGELVGLMQKRLAALLEQHTHLFITDAEGLFDRLVEALPEERRQHYRCSACRSFMTRYGGLVVIDEQGVATPALWGAYEDGAIVDGLAAGIRAIADAITKARVRGVFLTAHEVLGKPEAGGWSHFAVHVTGHRGPLHEGRLTAGQAMAAKLEEHYMLERGLAEFSLDVVQQAHTLLSTGALYRSEKCIGVAKWLLELHTARAAHRNERERDAVTWRAVAGAPAGFCHVRSGMIGTLLEDIGAGLPREEIKRRFDAKMHPLQYMRPTAAPSAGQIAEAEKIFEELQAAGALRRRFARVEEVDAVWRPPAPAAGKKPAGVFGHLSPKAKRGPVVEMPTVTMTWDKLSRTVLPQAVTLEFFAPTTPTSYGALVTAADPEAPPIIKWDRLERRNPVTWYVYVNGSPAVDWNLEAGCWHDVTAVTLRPSMWYGAPLLNEGRGVIFLVRGCRDLRRLRVPEGGAFFPEQLKGDFHGIRRTMEAYAKSATIEGAEEATACGLLLQEGVAWPHAKLRVTDGAGQVVTYVLDRWD
jgi:hypothetical protein